jgi:hypothetical protein
VNIQWQASANGNDFTNISGADTDFYSTQPQQTTYYRVFGSNGMCTDTSAVFQLTVAPLVVPKPVTNTPLICASDSAIISVPGNYVSYLWNDGDTTRTTVAKNAGNYWVSVTSANGCSAISPNVNISVYPVMAVSIIVESDTLSSYGATEYQWYFDGNIIPGATGAVYIAQQTGDYAVLVTDTNGCGNLSQSVPITIAGINEVAENNWLNIYPDPFNETLYIKMENTGTAIERLEIYDVLGRLTINKVYGSDGKSSDLIPVDVSALERGTY